MAGAELLLERFEGLGLFTDLAGEHLQGNGERFLVNGCRRCGA